MTIFQLDESINSRRFAKACETDNRCEVYRYPRRLKGKKDDVVLPDLLSKGAPFVTRDFRIVDENRQFVPVPNSGLIVAKTRDPRRTFTIQRAAANIANFKGRFPQWQETDWSDIYLQIFEDEVYVEKLDTSVNESKEHAIRLDDSDFANTLLSKLALIRGGDRPPTQARSSVKRISKTSKKKK